MFHDLLTIIHKIYQRYSHNGYKLLTNPMHHTFHDFTYFSLLYEIDNLHAQYQQFMKNTFQYYDTVRFVTLDMIYNVFKDIKKVLSSREFDNIILMGLQAYVSEQTLGTSFIYRDDSFSKELSALLHGCMDLWNNEKCGLMDVDFQCKNPYESSFKKEKHNKAIRVSAVFSMYISTGYYVKNTLLFLKCITKLHDRSKITNDVLLNNESFEALFTVVCETKKRMIIAENALKLSIEQLQYKIHIQRLKWGFYSFIHYDTCMTLKKPCQLNRIEYYKDKWDTKTYPKSVIDGFGNKQAPQRKNTITLPHAIDVASLCIDGIAFMSDIAPVTSNIKATGSIIQEIIEYCILFKKYSKQNSVGDVQSMMQSAHDKKQGRQKLTSAFFNFIDIFLPFATAKKTYDVISNLASVNSEHSNVTLLVLHKWNNTDVVNHNTECTLQSILSGSPNDIAYKIIKMNLIYFEEAYLNNSYYSWNTKKE